MKKTFKLSVPYLGKAVVVTVVSFSCAISAYQLYQNSSVFSPQSQALDLKNNQVVFSNQNQQTNTNQNQDESQYLNENQQALDKISQTNLNNSPYLFKNQGRVDPTKIYGQTGMGTNGGNTIGVNPNGTTNNGNVTVVIPGTGMPIATGDASSGIANDEVNKNTNHETTPIVDPDPEPTLPDLSNNEIYKDAISLPNTGIEQKENANYNIHFMAAEDLYLDNLTMLYDGCVITPWKLLCNMVVMISERKEGDSYPTLYRIENYNDNFKIGSYPQYATENFKVSFYFRLNESSPWQEYIYEFKVDYQARISLQDYNQQEIKYFYLKKDETEDLRKYYNLIIPTYQDSTQMFIGWKEEDGSVIEDQSDYTITQKGRITLVPQEMIDLPEGYIVQLQDKTIFSPIFATIYEYAFTNYVGDLDADIHVPDGIKKVELNDIFGKKFNGDFYISEIVDDISFGYGWTGPDLYGKYIVDENNPIFSSNEDGLLMDKSQTVILQTPIADAIYIPEGVTSISSSISWYVHDIYFEGKCLIDSHSFSNIPTDSTVHVPDQYYLDYFKKSYGSFVTSIVNENNESYDYTVSNNLVFSDDEKILVSTLDSASGTIVIPETVEKIADQAFSGNSNITQIILTEGNIELGHQIFKDSGVEDVMILTQDMPSVYKDTFSDSDNLKGISIARNYYHLYESKWSDLLEPTEFALLNETDSSLNVKDGFEYLEMYYRDRAHVTILLNAPSDLVYFDEDSIPGVIITEIGKNAFSNCKQLKSVKLSKQVVQIDSYAFYGCESLKNITLNGGELVEMDAFQNNGCETITLPSTMRVVDDDSFTGKNLKTVNLNDGLQYIGEGVFFSMGKIKNMTVPSSVTHIGEQAIGYYPPDPDNPFVLSEVIPNFVIYGTSGTEAQTYADRNGIQFNSIASGTTVKGTAKSYLSADDTVTIQLEKSGVAVYETTVKGNSTDYSISGVANGTYTMRVSKKSHADREYTVKVSSADVTQNVEIFPIGDVNSDGDISVVDATLVQKYIVGLEKLTDLQKKSAEVNGDGDISVVDATLIQKYIVGLENFS